MTYWAGFLEVIKCTYPETLYQMRYPVSTVQFVEVVAVEKANWQEKLGIKVFPYHPILCEEKKDEAKIYSHPPRALSPNYKLHASSYMYSEGSSKESPEVLFVIETCYE